MKVFIAGPRAIKSLDKNIENRLNSIIEKEMDVLVGDANGVDCLIQSFLSEKKYSNVKIYASNGVTRNNVGRWNVQRVDVEKNIKGFDFYAAKDKQMAKDADCGLMIWNGKSKGTLNNLINLSKQGKKVVVYLTPAKKFFCVDNLQDAEKLALSCGDDAQKIYDELIRTGAKSSYQQISLDIMAK